MIASELAKRLKIPILVESRPGANNVLGVQHVLTQPADGHTLLIVTATSLHPATNSVMKFDFMQEFTPVAVLFRSGLGIFVKSTLPVSSLADLSAYGKANPGKLNAGGSGAISELASAIFKASAGIDFVRVRYKSSVQTATAMASGEIQFSFDTPQAYKPFVDKGSVRMVAYTGTQRLPLLPNVPTTAEAGFPALGIGYGPGLWIRSGSSREIASRLASEVGAVLAIAEIRERIRALTGFEPFGAINDEISRQVTADWEQVTAAAKAIGFQPQ